MSNAHTREGSALLPAPRRLRSAAHSIDSRNDADTVWMTERQVEAAYRTRFDQRRHSAELLDHMYQELAGFAEAESCAWLIAVGHPRVIPPTTTRWDQDDAREMFRAASKRSLSYARGTTIGPAMVDVLYPRPGLRR
jgi:hypothetical protein